MQMWARALIMGGKRCDEIRGAEKFMAGLVKDTTIEVAQIQPSRASVVR
jgi:hypothetical protein